MIVLLLFFVSILLTLSCGGLGVALQQVFHVVDRPVVLPADLPAPVRRPVPAAVPAEAPVDTAPKRARPARPRPASVPQPAPSVVPEPTPQPAEDTPSPEASVRAPITVAGDATRVVARMAGKDTVLPADLPLGSYEIVVRFDGEPFAATTLVVLDGAPQVVTCRASLGICRVR